MRILAIRGENLASLAAPFEIDLTREPLAGAGLFAITGDTGAGKSTILDALCLALYNKYPRAQTGNQEGATDPGGSEIQASDPRNILRRSAGSGRAEVDFIGQDGIAYRATWAVRRARERATGRLQNVERKLDRMDGSGNVAVGISDVGASVVEKTGLTYDQFCRTVLLAQGEFDTFLLATEKDRADLLEKITGTAVYSRVSVRVHEEKDKREQDIKLRNASLAGFAVLSDEVRSALTDEGGEKAQALAERTTQLKALEIQKQRATAIREARTTLASAEHALAATNDRWEAARPDREHLAALDAIAPLRPLAEARSRARAQSAAAKTERAEAHASARIASSTLEAMRNDAASAATAAKAACDVVDRLRPEWDRAAHLDSAIRMAANELSDAESKHAEVKDEVDRQKVALDGVKARVASLTAQRSEIIARRASQANLAPLHDQRGRITELLDDEARITADLAAAWISRSAKEVDATELAKRIAASDGHISEKRDRLAQLRNDLERCREDIAALRLDDVEKRQRAVQTLDRLLADADRALGERDEAQAAMASVATDLACAETALREAAARIAELDRAHGEANIRRRALAPLADLAEATSSQQAEALRGHLIDGEPCPVCGSTHHLNSMDAVHSALVEKILAERAALDAEITRLQRAVIEERGKEADARAHVQSAARTRTEAITKRDASLASLTSLLPLISEAAKNAAIPMASVAEAVAATLSRAAVAAAVSAASEVAIDIEAIRAKARKMTARRDKLEGEIGALTDAIATAESSAKEDRRRAEDLRTEVAALVEKCNGLEEQRQRARTALIPFLELAGRTSKDLDDDIQDVRTRVAVLADAYAAVVTALANIEAELEIAKRRLNEAEASTGAADREFTRLMADVDKRRSERERLKTERAALLGGEPTASHRQRHEKAKSDAEDALRNALAEVQQAEIEQVRSNEVLTNALKRSTEATTALTDAETAFASALASVGRDEVAVATLLAVPPAARDEIAARIDNLSLDRQNALTTLGTRKSDLDKLAPRGDEATDDAIASLDATYARIDDEASALRKRATEIELELKRDADTAAKLASQRDEIERLTAELDVWRAIHDAIGSADGAKFKRYAQGITLRHLVALANRQLAALNPRYELRQSAASGLALDVVDREMGEDARSPRSLSGGERFLISLALALALSGLEGRQSFVDTLFIDEGFGSLDRDTLDIAIDALEGLQGEGRKVGLITHVQAMMDRIAVQIRVEKRGDGLSVVHVSDGASMIATSLDGRAR